MTPIQPARIADPWNSRISGMSINVSAINRNSLLYPKKFATILPGGEPDMLPPASADWFQLNTVSVSSAGTFFESSV